ncbi:hypothetical protein [Candidatus Nitrospira neomarina]|uniref:Uncharacterized protein n=1 Tax=Candidatus Nitrospira neomarina TaxID=3020899 RepID=A0AA96JXX3_9BACT|nr:hypothetical protein [Candidatus Nitrospira neomarina]WNM63585.1 hypothetical protein PQG83_07475 [Candidatus Nitrospira neomarina]
MCNVFWRRKGIKGIRQSTMLNGTAFFGASGGERFSPHEGDSGDKREHLPMNFPLAHGVPFVSVVSAIMLLIAGP